MNKKIIKKISMFLLVVFLLPQLTFAQELTIPNAAQKMLAKQKAGVLGANSLLDLPSGQAGATSAFQPKEKTNNFRNIPFKSDLEEYFAKVLGDETDKFKSLNQFGYDLFRQAGVDLSANSEQVVSQDYVLGPGDSFSVTMWGIAEGVFNVVVDPEGNIILPKIGVVSVAGLRYGELKSFIESQLGRYYEQVQVAVLLKNITGIRIYVVGEVQRPGTYNASSLATAYNALFLAGGPTKRGTLRDVRVIRGGRAIAHVDLYDFLLAGNRNKDISLISGDTVFVPVIGQVVAVAGNVRRSGIYEIKPNLDLSDLISLAGGVLPTSYVNRVQIQRVIAHEKKVVVDKQFNFTDKNPKFYLGVEDMDLIKVDPIYSEIDNIVHVEGAVKYPGTYQWKEGMRLKDLFPSSDTLVKGAYFPRAEVVRLDRQTFETSVISFELNKLLAGDKSQNLILQPGDRVSVGSELKSQAKVTIKGEVRLPGSFTVGHKERLSSVLRRAGGFTSSAYLFGAVFKRKRAKDVQESSIKELIRKMETDLIIKSGDITALGSPAENLAIKQAQQERNQELIEKIKETMVFEGRVIVALKDPDLLQGTPDDVELEDGDELMVPKIPTIVNVVGQVYNPSSLVYSEGKQVSYYLGKVGGPNDQANVGEIYLIRADGSIVSRRQRYNVQSSVMMAGDTILVPQSFERFDFWMALKDFTHWFYEATLAFAVIGTYVRK